MRNMLFVLVFSASAVFADNHESYHNKAKGSLALKKLAKGLLGHDCPEVKLSDEQRQVIKDIIIATKAEIMAQKETMHDLHSKVVEALYGLESTKEDTRQLIGEFVDGMLALGKVKGEAKLNILFDILTPEQRVAAVRCCFAKNGHGDGHGQGHGSGHHGGGQTPTPEK